MKRVLVLLLWIGLASPVFAQDVDLGLGGDASSLLNLPAPRGNTPPPRGRGGTASTQPVDRLVRLRELFAGANLPLAREQELALKACGLPVNIEQGGISGLLPFLEDIEPPGI